jgi:hypothetical protein
MKWLIGIALVMAIAHFFWKRAERRLERERPPEEP